MSGDAPPVYRRPENDQIGGRHLAHEPRSVVRQHAVAAVALAAVAVYAAFDVEVDYVDDFDPVFRRESGLYCGDGGRGVAFFAGAAVDEQYVHKNLQVITIYYIPSCRDCKSCRRFKIIFAWGRFEHPRAKFGQATG
ncbi:hypothetical protein SDC9_186801 [bioreactor metagenome]|uniref:Uncharacterized protein n=1 Tax=bioreactor metagenome TaxID=1076179 RepID=A0A645HV76_9ZZZZ